MCAIAIVRPYRGQGPLLQVHVALQEHIACAKAVNTGVSIYAGADLVHDRLVFCDKPASTTAGRQ